MYTLNLWIVNIKDQDVNIKPYYANTPVDNFSDLLLFRFKQLTQVRFKWVVKLRNSYVYF